MFVEVVHESGSADRESLIGAVEAMRVLIEAMKVHA